MDDFRVITRYSYSTYLLGAVGTLGVP
eukprot:COSAG01_NODE_71097_length_257_cov_0.518987_1_plen_26_part_01